MKGDFNPSQIKLVIGLGNPGKKYENTYHNVGHLFVNYLKTHNLKPITYNLKTDCYMNESGKFVRAAMKKRGLKSKELLIVHDDSDINIGDYKIDFDRGGAGHKGVESVIKALKTKKFWRLRIGIRALDPKRLVPNNLRPRAKAGELVLKEISPQDKKLFETVFREISREISHYFAST